MTIASRANSSARAQARERSWKDFCSAPESAAAIGLSIDERRVPIEMVYRGDRVFAFLSMRRPA